MPGSTVRFLDCVLWAVLKGEVESEGKIFVAVLVLVVRDVFFVDPVLISVKPVTPDYVVDELFFEASSELVFQWILFDPRITLRLESAT